MKSNNNVFLKKNELPYNLTIERIILAEVLLNKKNLALIFYKVRKDFFYLQNHQYIFEASKQVYEEQIEVNIDTVADRLKRLGNLDLIGGIEELINIINLVTSSNDIETYLVLLIDKHIRRQIIYGARKIEELSYQSFDSIETLFDEAERILFSVTQDKPVNNLFLASEVLLEAFVDLEQRSLDSQYSGVRSGFFDLDEITQGFQKSDLVIIAGRPSMGKTAFALNLIRNVAELQEYPVVIFSLEMSRQQLVYRFLSRESQVMHSKLRTGNIDEREWYAVSKAINVLGNLKIYLDDTPNLSLVSIRNKINILNLQYGNIGMIVLDYLQLLNDPTSKDTRVQELSRLTRGLKILAKEFDTPVIVLSQLSRSVESRVNKRPLLSDLRESGCVTGDMLIYMPLTNQHLALSQIIDSIPRDLVMSTRHNNKEQSLLSIVTRLKRAYYTGVKLVYKVEILNKTNLKITANHKIFSSKGWLPIDTLSNKELVGMLDICNFSKFLAQTKTEKIRFIPNIALFSILDIQMLGRSHCYDLWIPHTNNYIINNLIVHNSIEQDADLVLMLYRDSYYEKDAEYINENITEVIITKHRNGPVGTINILFEPKTLTFDNFVF